MEVIVRRRIRSWVTGGVVLLTLALALPAQAAGASRSKPRPAVTAAAPPARSAVGEAKVDAAAPPVATEVVKTEEAKEGVKTYTFGAQEVEGRLRSPQILYFLRRVRAEFEPQPLGHRSFLLELRDTRRHPAL